MSAAAVKFKGSKSQMHLDKLYKAELLDITVPAKVAYDMSDVFKNDMPFDKFSNHYYNWRRRKANEEERNRIQGAEAPTGTYG